MTIQLNGTSTVVADATGNVGIGTSAGSLSEAVIINFAIIKGLHHNELT